MVLAGVVHYKIQTQADPLPPAGVGQLFQVLHGSQVGTDGPEVADGIASVAAAPGGIQQGHEMEIVHAALLKIPQLFLYALQVPREGVHVEHHAQQVRPAVPVRVRLPLRVLVPEGLFPVLPAALQHPRKIAESALVPIQLQIQPFQLVIVPRQTASKFCFGVFHNKYAPPICHSTHPVRAWRGLHRCGRR